MHYWVDSRNIKQNYRFTRLESSPDLPELRCQDIDALLQC